MEKKEKKSKQEKNEKEGCMKVSRRAFLKGMGTGAIAAGMTSIPGLPLAEAGGSGPRRIGPVPLRAKAAEAVFKGKKLADAVEAAPKAVEGAQPMSNNGYKVMAAKGLLEEALRSIA